MNLLMLYNGFLTLLTITIIIFMENRSRKRHIALMTYLSEIAKSLGEEMPQPTAQAYEPNKAIEKGSAWNPSKDQDYVMKGKLVDFFD